MKRVGIALGSNLGDQRDLVVRARDFCRSLHQGSGDFLQSALYTTAPVGCPDGSGDYLNAVVEMAWRGSPVELLELTQREELRLGRVRTGIRCEPRTVDIDLLYMEGTVMESDRLTLPHPRLHQRKFVLKPLSDIRPELVVCGQRTTVAGLLEELHSSEPDPVLYAIDW